MQLSKQSSFHMYSIRTYQVKCNGCPLPASRHHSMGRFKGTSHNTDEIKEGCLYTWIALIGHRVEQNRRPASLQIQATSPAGTCLYYISPLAHCSRQSQALGPHPFGASHVNTTAQSATESGPRVASAVRLMLFVTYVELRLNKSKICISITSGRNHLMRKILG